MNLVPVTEIRAWSGTSNGQFHIDFLGVHTDCAFFPGLTPAKVGRIRTSLPQISELLIEYEACALAASAAAAAGTGFCALEIGAAWGVWTARSALLARALNLPARTIAVEAQPAFVEMMRRHYVANEMRSDCHHILATAAAASSDERVWFRFEGRGDVRGRVVPESWVVQNAGVSLVSAPEGVSVPCRDGTWAMQARCTPLKDILADEQPISFVHIRPNSGQSRLIAHDGLTPRGVGVVVIPALHLDEAKAIDAAFAKQGFRPVLSLNPGDEVKDHRSKVKLRNGMRIAVGAAVSEALTGEMAERFRRFAA
jgi:hypothetical protein